MSPFATPWTLALLVEKLPYSRSLAVQVPSTSDKDTNPDSAASVTVRRSVCTYGELVEAQHVHDTYLGNDCPKEVRPLVAAGSHQQAAIGASLHHTHMMLSLGLPAMTAVTNNDSNCNKHTNKPTAGKWC